MSFIQVKNDSIYIPYKNNTINKAVETNTST